MFKIQYIIIIRNYKVNCELSWIKTKVEENYTVVSVIKSNEKTRITRLRSKTLSKDMIKREFEGDGESYKNLLGVTQKNLPAIYDVFCENGMCTVFEEFIDGATVADILSGGLYTERGAAVVGSEVCDALFTLHSRDIIHRDVKPENVMITSDGHVVLIDLGAARIFKPSAESDTFIMGTVGYAAPEQFGFSQTGRYTDIFSLGVMLNVMLTGCHPSKLIYDGAFGRIIRRCIQIEPKKRFASAPELKANLQKFI